MYENLRYLPLATDTNIFCEGNSVWVEKIDQNGGDKLHTSSFVKGLGWTEKQKTRQQQKCTRGAKQFYARLLLVYSSYVRCSGFLLAERIVASCAAVFSVAPTNMCGESVGATLKTVAREARCETAVFAGYDQSCPMWSGCISRLPVCKTKWTCDARRAGKIIVLFCRWLKFTGWVYPKTIIHLIVCE